jgi:predicted nucleic acid-binding protein
MKYVIDSSVAVKWVLAEKEDAKARKLRDEYRNAIHELFAPDVFTTELAHALTRAERQKRITPGEALVLWTDVMTAAPTLIRAVPLTPRALEISSQMHIGVYDCLYVALAEREQCEFITADDRLVRNLHSTFPLINSLSTLP